MAVRVVEDKYEIDGGHCRFHAFKELAHEHAGDACFENVAALVVDASDERVAALRLAENVNREDLSPQEIAEAVVDAVEAVFTEEELAERLGWAKRNVYRSRSFTRRLRGSKTSRRSSPNRRSSTAKDSR